MTTLYLPTYHCTTCSYRQHFDPTNRSEVDAHFPEYPGLPLGDCPACFSRGTACPLGLVQENDERSVVGFATDTDLENIQVEDVAEDGSPIMEESNTPETKLTIVDGQPAVVEVSVYEPKMRSLTDDELASLKQQRDKNLDALSSVAV